MSTETLLSVQNLTVKYGQHIAVSDVSFTLQRHDFLAVIGANGSGKTTLIKTLLNLKQPHSGAILREPHLRIGYLPQNFNLEDKSFPATVYEIVSMGLINQKTGLKRLTQNDRFLIEKALQEVNIFPLKDQRIGHLSGGQQQRVLLARALVSSPDILIMDEPTSALDQSMRSQFFTLIDHLNRNHGVTIMLITHDLAAAGDYVKRVLYMDQRLLFDGSFEAFCENPQLSPFIHTHPLRHTHTEADHD